MANKQLLDCVNEVLKRVNVIDTANIGLLSSLTQSNIQNSIDVAVQVVNEGIDELYATTDLELPTAGAESSITLVLGQREYSLATNVVTLQWPFVCRANTQYLWEWKDSYEDFLLLDPQQIYTGVPLYAMISPITGELRLDRAPDSTVVGYQYYYEYKADMVLVNATDTVPFNNKVFRAMVPVWAELYSKVKRKEFDQVYYQLSLGRAARVMTGEPLLSHYSPRG